METIDTRSFKEKVQSGWVKFTTGVNDIWSWTKEHPVEAAGAVGLALTGVAEGRRIYDRAHEAHEDKVSRTSIWCGDVQGRVRLKHELNARENRELRDRMNSGQTRFEALDEMNLLK